eukprot:5415275-Alexandrium_andersonii.AAC.1
MCPTKARATLGMASKYCARRLRASSSSRASRLHGRYARRSRRRRATFPVNAEKWAYWRSTTSRP